MTLRIGVPDQYAPGWTAGASFTTSILRSLLAVAPGRAEVVLLSRPGSSVDAPGVRKLQLAPVDPLPGEELVRRLARSGPKRRPLRYEVGIRERTGLLGPSHPFGVARREGLDVLIPAVGIPRRQLGVRSVTWIPDFQHLHLPEYFSPDEIAGRNESARINAERADAVFLSSRSVLADFQALLPDQAHKASVASFPSQLVFERPAASAPGIAAKYGLEPKFALVVNQYWLHKNHRTVIQAAGLLRREGLRIPIAMTGMPADYRDPQNDVTSQLLQAVATHGVAGQVVPLGKVPWPDLIALLRSAAVLIQPSLFEGWSTSIEDAKALGRPMICSDLPVHREQVPEALGFFEPRSPEALAALLREVWPGLPPGPDPEAERRGMERESAAARAFGEQLLSLCERVVRRG